MSLFLGVNLDMALAYSTRGFDPIRWGPLSRILVCNIPLALKGIEPTIVVMQFEH